MLPYELDAAFEQIFRKKLRVRPRVDPRAVEIDIFADLITSKRQKWKEVAYLLSAEHITVQKSTKSTS